MSSTSIANTLFKLPELKYDFGALEPHIDAETMEIHYTKHHQGYVNKFNKAIEGKSIEVARIEDIFAHVSNYSSSVRNNGGGHYNHSFFWNILSPKGGGEPEGDLAKKIKESFGSLDGFKERFTEVATSRFGSGWAWLVLQGDELAIGSTPNQDNPLMDVSSFKGTPILGLDVWEHAYYLKYRNKRAEYINAFWNVINWEEVEKNYNNALSL